MNTIETINSIVNTRGAEAYRSMKKGLCDALDQLYMIYRADMDANATPAHTVKAWAQAVGYDLAAVVLASVVNRSAWDGRISSTSKAWALTVAEAWDEESANRMLLSAGMHMAHINQLAEAFAKLDRADALPA